MVPSTELGIGEMSGRSRGVVEEGGSLGDGGSVRREERLGWARDVGEGGEEVYAYFTDLGAQSEEKIVQTLEESERLPLNHDGSSSGDLDEVPSKRSKRKAKAKAEGGIHAAEHDGEKDGDGDGDGDEKLDPPTIMAHSHNDEMQGVPFVSPVLIVSNSRAPKARPSGGPCG